MNYVGIDLGTTNSVICSFDGERLQLYKSVEQHDVTPSAIFIDKRGNKYFGARARNNAARSPDNAALNFKRLMGTSTPISLPAVNLTLTPEECSAEILRLLHGYLPPEIRDDDATGYVVTVPAAFNQMQKDATMTAAASAGIGRVALMQEPVAAVMSVMRTQTSDGIFMVYDLGGGTLDVAIAESTAARVSLLAHGGITMCGGRDFDRAMFDNVVKPWLLRHFDLPDDLSGDPKYRSLERMGTWAAENAKIALSQRDGAVISLTEGDFRVHDLAGEEVYIEIPIDRAMLDGLIAAQVDDSIEAARDTLARAGLSASNVDRIVFVGGPTQYPALRERVAAALGVTPSTDVNPMTAVAEGAAVFAESIDWSTESHGRRPSRGMLSGGSLAVSFDFVARTPDAKARIVARIAGEIASGAAFQADSLDSGWTSGRIPLNDGATVELLLSKPAENWFKIFVFDSNGALIALPQDRIVICRTAASIDAIPASHSIGIEVLERPNGTPVLDYLVRAGDRLPAKGRREYKAAESLRSGGAGSIKIRLWEGDIADPVHHNQSIGALRINGADIEQGVIGAGEKLVVDYEVLDSGNIDLKVSVPSIGVLLHSGRNFYSRHDGQIDYTKAAKLIEHLCEQTSARLEEMSSKIDDDRLDQARARLDGVRSASIGNLDPEIAKRGMDTIQEARRLLALVRRDHLADMRRMELDIAVNHFEQSLRKLARPAEATAFDKLVRTAQRAIDRSAGDFETHLDGLRSRNFQIMWRQDWFAIDRFKALADAPHLFPAAQEHADLVALGAEALEANDIDKLRSVVAQLDAKRFWAPSDADLAGSVNLLRG
ncbi:MAG TPA: Hsp70 family protein [Steroidobacteraceae bacterium]|jgi:molecular chaperone DnaK|nr:Hsp70 family protein [Steroidobacteraceae bacterium]